MKWLSQHVTNLSNLIINTWYGFTHLKVVASITIKSKSKLWFYCKTCMKWLQKWLFFWQNKNVISKSLRNISEHETNNGFVFSQMTKRKESKHRNRWEKRLMAIKLVCLHGNNIIVVKQCWVCVGKMGMGRWWWSVSILLLLWLVRLMMIPIWD